MSETSDAGRLVQQYLASKGLQATGENVSRALQMNAQNPGLIGGLVNQAPPQAEMASMVDRAAAPHSAPALQPVPQPAPQQAAPPPAPMPPPANTPSDAAGQRGDPAPPSTPASGGMNPMLQQGLQAGGGAAALAALAALLPKGTPPDPTPPPNVSAPTPPQPTAEMGPPQHAIQDDGLSVPPAEEMGLPRRAAATTPSQLLKEQQMREGQLDMPLAAQPKPYLPEGQPMPAVSEVMRHSQSNPEGVGSLLTQMMRRAGHIRGFRP